MLVLAICIHAGEICESKLFYVLEVHDVDFIMPCGVGVFALLYFR